MLITVYSSKHHLILIWIFFFDYIRSFLKNRMQHLAEAAPVNRTQDCNFNISLWNILIDDYCNISIFEGKIKKRKERKAIGKIKSTCNHPSNWLDKNQFKSDLNNSGVEKKSNSERIHSSRYAPLLYLPRKHH